MRTVERVAARVLLWGGMLGIALMVVATVLAAHAMSGVGLSPDGRTDVRLVSPVEVARTLGRHPADPAALGALGVLTLLATPVAAVGATLPAFLLVGEVRYATIAALLLAALVASFVLGAVA
jgi:uncharacterized membrane protein